MQRLLAVSLAVAGAVMPTGPAQSTDRIGPTRLAQAADDKQSDVLDSGPAEDAPLSRDDLFGDTDPPKSDDAPMSKDDLFGTSPPSTGKSQDSRFSGMKFRGFVQQETAYTYADPTHWSRAVFRTEVGATGRINSNLKWKATIRGDVDPLYFGTDFYNDEVKRDERAYFLVGETYVDTSLKGWDLRIGRQNIVWGEMVGLFFADVVSAKDMRSFILPSFDIVRIPQWAGRAEYFIGDSHLEFIWIPYNTYDNIGRAGSEFFPVQAAPPPGFQQQFRGEVIPSQRFDNSNFGGRFSTLLDGWDMSAFYYRSTDATATFQREIVLGPTPTIFWQPRHDRIWQAGGTFSKDLGPTVLKGEVIYSDGRSFNVTRLAEPTGLVSQNTWDWVLGFDLNLPRDTRLNIQGFQRIYLGHDPDLYYDRVESGASFLLNVKLVAKWEAEWLHIQSLNRQEYLSRPRIVWKPQPNLRVAFGVDVFEGPITGFFGRYRDRDRVYVETRYDF